MRNLAELLTELERVDFELARLAGVEEALPWMENRGAILDEIGSNSGGHVPAPDIVRLAAAASRGRELENKWRQEKARLRAEAENLFAAQLLLKAVTPERRGQHFSFES